jgi:hypothetical protein
MKMMNNNNCIRGRKQTVEGAGIDIMKGIPPGMCLVESCFLVNVVKLLTLMGTQSKVDLKLYLF